LATVVIQNSRVSIEVPEDWVAKTQGLGFECASSSGDEQIIVTILLAKRPLAPLSIADKMFEARQKVVRELSQGHGMLEIVKRQEDPEVAMLEFAGVDGIHAVMLYGRIVVTSAYTVTVAYNGYGQTVAETFVRRAEVACATLVLKPEPAPPKRWWWPF
jgi:hypothetical protein